MGLPWVRVDSNIGSHDKILNLLADPSPKKWQAAFAYICAIGWSADQETNGHVPKVALGFIHATPTTARLLEQYQLWEQNCTGWVIVNFAKRQQLSADALAHVEAASRAGKKANCKRHHGETCWVEGKGCYRLDGPF